MGEPRFHIDMARRISTVAEAIDFLLILEKQNRDSVKHIVLDCSAQLAKARKKSIIGLVLPLMSRMGQMGKIGRE